MRGALKDFEVFRDIDAPWCPEMVVIPSGTFLMGSPPGLEDREAHEGPQHRVTIGNRFALGKYAVRFSEYDHFCEVTKRKKPSDQGWGRGQRPVINVSWRDAVVYCEWLAKETGQPYRLPSESEWEYACRAGTTTPFSFGGTISPKQANYDGNYTYGGGSKGEYRQRTVPVGTLPANPWGLHEMHGNVWEWVADVWHDSYQGAPADGSAWTDGEGKDSSRYRVIRGGSWGHIPGFLRSAFRIWKVPVIRYFYLGFRLARTLD
ncbi:MAG: formylglycine-generating enzyme family protein [Defluviicoccus sp.]|nr:formylglycine-generating enzyme family protein [Defluviicoccus sp.]